MRRTRSTLACFLVVLVALVATSCDASPFSPLPDDASVRWGRTCGFISQCRDEVLDVTRAHIRLTLISTFPPDSGAQRTEEHDIDARRWSDLKEMAEKSGVGWLPDHTGPILADVGNEWVEVEASGAVKRVTFNRGDPPPAVAALTDTLRAMRAEFQMP
jgi:hypothetical protein